MTQQNVKGAAQNPENHSENKHLPSFDDLYSFLKSHYKAERFEGRNTVKSWEDYSKSVTQSALDSLAKYGFCVISKHEDRAGNGFKFNTALDVI